MFLRWCTNQGGSVWTEARSDRAWVHQFSRTLLCPAT